MHKLCKRALSLALALCLLLSVLPAVSAAEPTTQTYSFAKPSYAAQTSNYYPVGGNNLRTDYPDGANWYALAAASSGYYLKYENNNILMNNIKNGGYWMAFVIRVPAAGTYNLTAEFQTRGYSESENKDGFPSVDMHLLDPYATLPDGTDYKTAIAGLNGTLGGRTTSLFADYNKVVGGTIDGTLTHGAVTSYTTGYAYLGNCQLKAQDYILLVDTRFAYTTASKYFRLRNIALTPGEDGSAFVLQTSMAAFSNWNNKTWRTAQVAGVYQLGADLSAPESTLYLGSQDFALNGNRLTVDTVYSAFIEGNNALKLNDGVISGLTGNGTLKVTGANAPMLPYGGQQTMLLKGADNAYQFTTPGLISGKPFTGQSFMEDPANTGFAFKIDMETAAKALVAGGNSGVQVSMEWTLGDTKGTTVQFSSNFVKDWGAGNGDTFYIEVKDAFKLLKEYGAITCTPKITGGNVSFTGKPITFTAEKQAWDEDGELKILLISNSFGIDTHEYAWQIAENLLSNNNVEFSGITIGTLYHPNCSIDEHIAYLDNPETTYDYFRWTKSGGMSYIHNTPAKSGIVGDAELGITGDWDYIGFSTVVRSSYSGSYKNLDTLMDKVEALSPSAKFVWNMTWGCEPHPDKANPELSNYGYENTDAGTLAMYNDIIKQTQDIIVPNERFSLITHPGTAVQNARTSFMGSASYRNSDGFRLTRDCYHMSYGTGRYIAAATYISEILKDAVPGIDVTKLTWKPANVPADEARVAIESVRNAIANPYAITPSRETTQDVIPAKGNAVDLGIMGSSMRSATSKANRVYTPSDSAYAYKYATTKVFTKAELPVGTVIELAEGYQYAALGWVNGQSGTYRPSEITISKVVIDELWWGEHTEKAFNICRTDGTAFEDDSTGITNALKIYIPDSASN